MALVWDKEKKKYVETGSSSNKKSSGSNKNSTYEYKSNGNKGSTSKSSASKPGTTKSSYSTPKANKNSSYEYTGDIDFRNDEDRRSYGIAGGLDISKFQGTAANQQSQFDSMKYNRGAGQQLGDSNLWGQNKVTAYYNPIWAGNLQQAPGVFPEEDTQALLAIAAEEARLAGQTDLGIRARMGDASVLAEQSKRIADLEKAGLDNKWYNNLFNINHYTNQDEIDVAEDQYKEYVRLLKLSGMENLTAALPKASSMVDYTRDAFQNDLMTMVYAAQGVDIGTDEYQAAAKRVRDFTGNTHAESDAFADVSGRWVDKYLNMYDQRMGTLDKYIAKNSSASGTEYAFDADDYIQYMRDLRAHEQRQAAASQRETEKEAELATYSKELAANADYAQNSQYIKGGDWYTSKLDSEYGVESADVGSMLNDLVNAAGTENFDAVLEQILAVPSEYNSYAVAMADRIRYMDEEDKLNFAYKYNTSGLEAAQDFLQNELSWKLGKQQFETELQQRYENVSEGAGNAALYSAGSIVENIAAEIGGLAAGVSKLLGQEVHEYDPRFLAGELSNVTRSTTRGMIEDATQGIEILGHNVAGIAYNGLMSALDSAANTMLFGHGATGMMAAGAFGSTYQENLASMGDNADTFIDALVDGAIEAATEYFSVETLLDDAVSSGFKTLLRQALTEPSEEVLGELMRTSYDMAKYGENSQINQRISELMVMGYSPADAEMMAASEFMSGLTETILTAVVSGAAGGTSGAVQNTVANYQTGLEFQENADDDSYEALMDLAGSVKLSNSGQKIYNDLKSGFEQKQQAGIKNQQAQENAQKQKNAEIADDLDTDDLLEEQQPEKNAQAQQEAEQRKDEKIAEDLSAENARNELTPGKKKNSVSRSKLGQLYRETMQKLDAQAQDSLREYMSFNVAKELKKLGVSGRDAKNLAGSILRIQDGTFSDADAQAIAGSAEARNVLIEWTAKENTAQVATNKVNKLSGLLAKNGINAARDLEDDTDEQTLLGDDEFDAVVADVQEREGSTLVAEGEASTLDGEEIEVLGVEGAENGAAPKVKIRTADGEERSVAADSIAYGNNDESTYQLAAFSAEYGKNADQMFNAYVPGKDVVEYARAFHKAAQYGSDGRNLDVLKGSDAVSVLNEQQLTIAYEIGRGMRAVRNKAQQAARSTKGANVDVGNVDTSAIRKVNLTTHQKKSIAAMGKIAKALGINVRFVQSRTDARGYYTDDNGAWNANTRTLTLSIDAGGVSRRDIRFAMMDTAGHELTHYIKQFADSGLWDEYQDFMMGKLDTKLDLEAEIRKLMASDKTLDRDAAIEEVIADASVNALSKISEQDLTDLAESNPTLFGKIKKFLDKWIKNMKRAIKEAFDTTMGDANRFAKAMEDNLDEMAAKWNRLLVDASKNAGESRSAVLGVEIDTDTQTAAIKNSRRSLENSEYAKNPDKMAAALAKAVDVPVTQAKRYIKNMFSIAKIIAGDQTRLDYEGNPLNSVLKDNSEYRFTVDMSTLCAKRLIYTGTLDAIQKAMPNTVLTSEDLCELRKLMMDRDYEVACGICYVESRRRELGSITKGFVDAYNDALANGEDMMLGPKNNRQAFPTEGGNMLTLADVNTTEGIENIQLHHPKIYAAYMKYMNSRGVSKPKLIETRTDYRGEILQLFNSKRAVNDRNENGGLRIQSFSDFEVVHLIDMMQVITDMGQVGLSGQAYTKVPNFAEAIGRTGLKINLSLIAKGDGMDADGNLIFDDIEGMPAADAFRLRKKYSKNVGTILVGKSDAHIRAALADPRIDFVIPFHKSGWSESLYEKLGLKNYSDYTNFQNERAVTDSSFKWDHSKSAGENYAAINKIRDKSRHIDNFLPMDYWDFSLSGEENARNYLEACYYDGRIPKFPQFVNEPGYWKLLIDFKMYDNNGEGSPQLPVKPDFNMTQARRMLKEYDGGHAKLPVAQDVVDDFVKQYKDKPDVKRSKRTTDAEYLAAYEAGDEVRARELVREAAIAAGYNPLKLYHGTTSFGFTKVDPGKADDGISFFTSSDDMVAQTYVGKDGHIRRVSTKADISFDQLMKADGEKLLSLLQKYVNESYEIATKEELRNLAREEGERLRENAIPWALGYKEEQEKMFSDEAVVKAFDFVVDALDRMSFSNDRETLDYRFKKYEDARYNLGELSPEAEAVFSWALSSEIYNAYYNMHRILGGNVFKIDGELSVEYTYQNQAIDMLRPKLFKGIYELFGKTDNLLEINGHGANWNRLDGYFLLGKTYASTRDFAEYAKEMGFDGVHFHNIHDVSGGINYNAASDIYTFFNPSDVKSADPFTFDDDGNLIPLSERFNRADEDIRHSIRETTDGHKVVVVENDILNGIYDSGKWTPEQKAEAKKAARGALESAGPIYSGGIPIYINADTREEFPSSNYVRRTLGKKKQILADRYRIASEAEDMLIATPKWERDSLMKPRKDFVRFIKGRVYMSILGRNYEAVVKVGVKNNGGYVLYDLVDMENASFEIKKESISSAAQAKKAVAPSSELPSNGGIITQDSEERKRQMRDPYNASDRELLANALESLTANADELDILRRYQKRVQNLDAKQQQLQEIEDRLHELKQGDAKANRDEIIKLTNNAKTVSGQISRMDKELLKLEVMAPIKKLAERERENYKQKLKAKTDDRIRRYKERTKAATQEKIRDIREREAEKRRKLREQGDTRLRKAVDDARKVGQRKVDRMTESNLKAKYKPRIQKDVSTMREWLTRPTNKGHVPQFLRVPLADFLESLDFTSDRALKGGDSTQADAKLLEKMDAMRRALANTRRQQSDIENGEAAFRGYLDLPEGFAEQFDEALADIKRTLAQGGGDTPINRMTGEQLKELSNMIRTINTAVRKMNSFLAGNRYQQISDAAHNTMSTLAKLGEKISKNDLLNKVSGFLDWTNTTPYYAFKRFGEGGKAIFEGLMNGWDSLAFNSKELIDYANSAYTTKQVREWSQQLHTIELNGKKVQMTTAQIMSLYCLNKRDQARGHLLGGGIRVADIQVKGKTITQADNHIMTDDDIMRITDLLTNEQVAVADKLQHFMNTRCTEWGNEVSMKRFGYEAFGDEVNYFPIETDSNNRKAIDDQAQENSLFRLLNISATKNTVKNANNALVVRDIFDVFSAHGADMAKYNALALPILDALKWYNYVDKTNYEDGSLETESIQKALEKAYGKDAQKYIKNFLRDLNGVREGGRNDGMFNKMLSNYKIAAVAANLRVGMLQITSMPRAAYAIDPKYLAIGTAKNVAMRNSKAATQNVGIGLWKSLGFYDTNISRNIREMVKHDQSLGGIIKEKSMILVEKGDAWTMGVLYGAVEAEMADKHPGVKKGSDAYNQMVNERMREIVYQTQVVDSTMTRSDIMRDTGAKSSLATAFMSEPTLTMNMLADSIYEQRMKARATGKKFMPSGKMVKAFAVTAMVMTFSAVMEAAFTAWRDDDEYETFKEKYEETFLPTLLDNMNLLNNIPFVKDIVSAIQGNSADRMESAWAYNLWQGVEEIYKYLTGKSTNPAYSGIYKTINGLSQMSGFAVGGLTRELVSAYNSAIAAPMGYKKIQTYNDSAKDAAGAILNAAAAGDEGLAARYIEVAAQHGIEGDKLENAMKTVTGEAYAEGTIDAEIAEQMMVTYGGKTSNEMDDQMVKWDYEKTTGLKYSDMKADYIAGKVDRKTALKYHKEDTVSGWDYEKKTGSAYSDMREDYLSGRLNVSKAKQYLMTYGGKTEEKAEEQIDRWDYYEATGDSDGYTKYWRMYYAFENGGDFQTYAKEWINAGVKKSTIASSIAGRYKEEYLAIKGTAAGDRLLERLLDLYEAIGYDREYERNYINTKWKAD